MSVNRRMGQEGRRDFPRHNNKFMKGQAEQYELVVSEMDERSRNNN